MARSPVRLVVHGAAGRMGQRVIAGALAEPADWLLVAAVERAGHPQSGADAGPLAGGPATGVAVADSWDVPADVVIDFSLPEAVEGIIATCLAKRVPLVVATTGLTAADHAGIS